MDITDFEVSGSDPEPTPPPAVVAEPTPTPAPVETAIADEKDAVAEEVAAATEDEPQERDEQGKFKPKKSVQARIDRITFEREAARREAEALRAELAALRTPKAEPAPEAPKVAAPAADEPKLEKFETYEDWIKAWNRWNNKQEIAAALAAEKAAQQQEHERRTQREQVSRFQAQLASARQKYADWDSVISAGDAALAAAGVQLPPVMVTAIMASDKATDLMRDLATHPEDAIQLARDAHGVPVSAAPLMRSVLERRVVSSAAHSGPAAPPVRSIASPPIKPVGGSPVVTDAIPSDDADFDTHAAYWNRKDKERRK